MTYTNNDMTLQAVLDRLEGAKKTGDCYMAKCPAHKDKTPSLSVKEAEDGMVLLHCFAGCLFDDVRSALGFSTPIPPVRPSSKTTSQGPPPRKWFMLPVTGAASITEAAKEIFTTIAPTESMFVRGGRVVELLESESGSFFNVLTPSAFRSRIERYGRTVGVSKFIPAKEPGGKGEYQKIKTLCPENTAKALLETREALECLPSISLILSCPVITPDGRESIIGMPCEGGTKTLTKGYHPEMGGTYVKDGEDMVEWDLDIAVNKLKSLLADFRFSTPADESRALASLITPAICFGGFLGSANFPIDMAEADQSQAGKGYRHQLVAAIYGETPYIISQRQGGVGSMDESLSQALVAGRPIIQFDNLRGKMNSPTLESFLTCGGTFAARIPHRGEVLVDASRVIMQATSNGIETTRDLANRASIVRIKKQPEGYKFKKYFLTGDDILGHVKWSQRAFLGLVFAVVREWVAKGMPRTDESRHDMREWAGTMDWIVQNIFNAAPLMDGHQAAQMRTTKPELTWLRKVALALAAEDELGKELRGAVIAEFCRNNEIEVPGLTDPDDEKKANMRVGSVMQKIFKESESIEVDGYLVTRREWREHDPSNRKDIRVRGYIFAAQPACGPLRTTPMTSQKEEKAVLEIYKPEPQWSADHPEPQAPTRQDEPEPTLF